MTDIAGPVGKADRLTSQLTYLPQIIRDLGMAVADAQVAFNADYVRRVGQILRIIERSLGDPGTDAAARETLRTLLEQLIPPRYQFTETTLDFSADLAESMDMAVSAGLGVATPAIAVNAAFSLGYGYDYRAAARITTVLHATNSSKEFAEKLLARAGTVHEDKQALPARSERESELFAELEKVHKLVTDNQLRLSTPADSPIDPPIDPPTDTPADPPAVPPPGGG